MPISGSLISEEAPQTINIVSPTRGDGLNLKRGSSSGDSIIQREWPLTVGAPPAPRRQKIPAPVAAPPAASDFVRAVAAVPGVKCAVVEQIDNNVIHITTFAEPLTEEARERIYSIEAETIQCNPNSVFDFHVRSAKDVTGDFARGKHYFAVWGEISADHK